MKKFFKWFAIIFFTLFLLISIGLFIFLKTFDINRYKPQIITAAHSALNRNIDFSDISLEVSLKEGIRASIKDIKLAEHPSFGNGTFLSVKEVFIGVDILAYVLKKEFSLTKIHLESPSIIIIREKDNTINAQTLAPAPTAQANPGANTQAAPPMVMPAVFISTLDVNDASVVFVDRSGEKEFKTEVSHIDFALNGFSLTDAFTLSLKAAVLNNTQNLNINGRAKINMNSQSAEVTGLQIILNLGTLDLNALKNFPLPPDVPLPEVLKGDLQLTFAKLTVGAGGLGALSLNAGITNGAIKINNVAEGINLNIPSYDFSISNLSLSNSPFQFKASAAFLNSAPNITLDGTGTFNMENSNVSLKNTTASIDLAQLNLSQLKSELPMLKDAPLPQTLNGELKTTIKNFNTVAGEISDYNLSVELANGAVVMDDVAPGVNFAANQISFLLDNLSNKAPGKFNLKAAYLNKEVNIIAEGNVDMDLNTQEVRISKTKATVDLAKFSPEELRASVEALKDVPFPDELKGTLGVSVEEVIVSPKGLGTLTADAKLSDGKVYFASLIPDITLELSQITADILKLSLDNEFSWNVKAAYLSDLPNLNVQGAAKLNLEEGSVTITDTNFNSELEKISLDKMRASMAMLKDVPLPEEIKGKLTSDISQLKIGAKGLESLSGNVDITNALIRLKELAVPFEAINSHITLNESIINLESFIVTIGNGTLKANGTLSDYIGRQNYQINLDIKDVKASQLIDQKDFPIKVQGTLLSNFKLNGHGFDPATMFDALNGEGTFELTDGKLTDINILKLVLDKITIIPNFRQVIEDNIPLKYKEKIEKKDTILTKVSTAITIKNGRMDITPIDFNADSFLFQGSGHAAFDQSFGVQGSFIIPQDLTYAMTSSVSELELLQDIDGQIRFPLKVEGKGAAIKFMPDIKAITSNAFKNKAKQELGNVLNKVLKTESEPAPPPTQPQDPSATPPVQEKKPEQILIEGIMNQIFK